jgi:hypothetical protein
MKDCGTHYEYLLAYIDDLMFIGTNPQALYDALLKGVGKPSYHLGGDFFRGTLAWGAQSYVKKMLHNYEIMFEGKP